MKLFKWFGLLLAFLKCFTDANSTVGVTFSTQRSVVVLVQFTACRIADEYFSESPNTKTEFQLRRQNKEGRQWLQRKTKNQPVNVSAFLATEKNP